MGNTFRCMQRGRASSTGAGGQVFHGPWGESVAANLTPDMETGIGSSTDAEIKTAITSGVRADGTELLPPMAFRYYRNTEDEDLNALQDSTAVHVTLALLVRV